MYLHVIQGFNGGLSYWHNWSIQWHTIVYFLFCQSFLCIVIFTCFLLLLNLSYMYNNKSKQHHTKQSWGEYNYLCFNYHYCQASFMCVLFNCCCNDWIQFCIKFHTLGWILCRNAVTFLQRNGWSNQPCQ